jgi:hypothetical protein
MPKKCPSLNSSKDRNPTLTNSAGGHMNKGSICFGVWVWIPYVANTCCKRTDSDIATTWMTRSEKVT